MNKQMHPARRSMRYVTNGERVAFRCQRCGRCCRQAENAIMVEPPDIYRLSQHLRDQDAGLEGPDVFLDRYAHPLWIAEGYPAFVLNTEGKDQACVFLKDGKCSVYDARPRVCRQYPFGVAPGSNGRDFTYYLCTEQPHHFGNGSVKAGTWISENFSKEEREYLKADYALLPLIGKAAQSIGEERFQRILFQFLFYRYFNYELDQLFLPQYHRNTQSLKALLDQACSGSVA